MTTSKKQGQPRGFRPLAGISCFLLAFIFVYHFLSFRPLAGISCFYEYLASYSRSKSFRPLAGISCFLIQLVIRGELNVFVP